MSDITKTITVSLGVVQGARLLQAIDQGGLPWQLVCDTYDMRFSIWVDGESTGHSLVLNPNGTWDMETEVPV